MKRLELLDYARFFAAIVVVLFHYTFNGIQNGKIDSIEHIPWLIEITKYGYLGVELFFMISGFVIFYSSKNRTAAQFAVSRALRLYPSYWFAVIFTSIFALVYGGDLMSVYPAQIVMNMTLLQNYFAVGHVDGVYWTLVYEIQFYALVFVLLLLGFQQKLNLFFLLWPFFMLTAYVLNVQNFPLWGGYFSYFSAGALFALLQSDKTIRNVIALGVAYFMCVVFSTSEAVSKTNAMNVYFSEQVVGFLVSLFFVFFIIQNTHFAQKLSLPYSKVLGALTFPVYLIHAHFGYMMLSEYATEENKVILYILIIMAVISVSYFMNKIIEIRLSNVWKSLFMLTLYRVVALLQIPINKLLLR